MDRSNSHSHSTDPDSQRVTEQYCSTMQHLDLDPFVQAELPQPSGFGRIKLRPVYAGDSRDAADRQPIQGQGMAHLHLRAIIK
jgi:hypothetical protein